MTIYYVGAGGSNLAAGTSWALRRLTLASLETLMTSAGDIGIAGPGTYRESVTLGSSGGNAYTTGTVSVTRGSAVVTGSGTLWLANAFANGMFQSTVLAHGTDMVTNGTSTATSATGNFQAGHIGLTIRIGTKAAYVISAVASATSITLANADGTAGSPSAGSGLTYDVGPESPYEILSVDTNTQITLKTAWSGPTFTGIAYTTWRDIKWIGDESGLLTDGIGGQVRVTGSDDDISATRASCFIVGARSYRTIRGFSFDTASGVAVTASTATNCIVEQFTMQNCNGLFSVTSGGANHTIRRGEITNSVSSAISFSNATTVDNAACLVENVDALCVLSGSVITMVRIGGVLIRNILSTGIQGQGVRVTTVAAVGQATTVNNSIFTTCNVAIQGVTTADIIEDYNSLFNNTTSRSNTTTGAHSTASSPLLALPLMTLGVPGVIPASLSANSTLKSIAGLNPPVDDMYGTLRTATSSWGPYQYTVNQRPADAGPSHNRKFGGS